jgi:hypothetical protein
LSFSYHANGVKFWSHCDAVHVNAQEYRILPPQKNKLSFGTPSVYQ